MRSTLLTGIAMQLHHRMARKVVERAFVGRDRHPLGGSLDLVVLGAVSVVATGMANT
jgi:hypothetical protein